jgi:hypothetical protein
MGIKVRLAGMGIVGIAAGALPALVLLTLVSVSLFLGARSSHAAPLPGTPPGKVAIDVFLTVHGPNDGEPLNDSIELETQSNVTEPSYVLVYRGNMIAYMVPMDPSNGFTVSTTRITVDTTRFPNGPLTLSFLLFNDPLDHVLARADWSGTVENPLFETGDHRTEERIPVTLQGLAGDFGYMLLASADPADLLGPPMEQPVSEKVQIVATGFFPNPAWNGFPSTDLVLNLDDLVRLHTSKGSIILWTLDIDGKWYRSKVVSIKYLLSIPTSPYGDHVESDSHSGYRP